MNNLFPARLHVLFASNSSRALIIRRGPSKQVCSFLWDRQTDSIEVGQWLKGRIYERRSDISPDGKYFIYFAMNGKWDSETRGSWTAISKVPYIKAIELYAKGDCWEGGGLFLNKNTFWLNDRYFNNNLVLFDSKEVKRDASFVPEGNFGSECTGVYYRRLIRDGWQLEERKNVSRWKNASTFTKALVNDWQLIKLAHEEVDSPEGKGCYWDEHMLLNKQTGIEYIKDDWEWADRDGDSIAWTSNGCLYRASLQSKHKLGEEKLIHDFNHCTFQKLKAPY
ncbi:hypothetical protein [Pleionea sediminis]|uniref:hypothetical protein n=1 Tax=Pleionea sediminis TaxID=2569479 RepID=UPI0011849065|nr:hypothetical protein [Pleionea sediminis]